MLLRPLIQRQIATAARIHRSTPAQLPTRRTVSRATMATASDIKTHQIPADELKDGQMKEVEMAGGKVLVSRIKGQVYATSAFCTHYGAPLIKGVISQDGRIVCPWHGACFKAQTGDIEDAPGLDSLWKFEAKEENGQITISASEKDLQSKVGRVLAKRGVTTAKAAGKEDETVVIVGGGSGGIHTIESLRTNGWKGKIVCLSEEKHAPIDRPKMSKQLLHDVQKLSWRKEDELKDDFGVDFRKAVTVTKIDSSAQTVTTSDGTSVKYDHLVIAPGAKPKRLPLDGKDLGNVFTLRFVDDTKNIASNINKESEVVIIGTSWIGMEVAQAAIKKEPKSVTLVGVDKIPFAGLLGEEIGGAIMESMKKQGIKFHMQAEIQSIKPSDSDSSRCGSLALKGADDLPASVIVMSTGVAPATGFLKESGFNLEKDGGIRVDQHLRVSGHKNIYAIGDIAHYDQYPEKNTRRVEHWNVAGNMGREAAYNITHPDAPTPFDKVPIFWSSVGKGLRYVGTGAGYDDIYTDGNPSELKFASYQARKDGTVTAVTTMQRDPIVAKSSELMRLGLMPKLDEIRGGKNILDIELVA